MRGRFFALGFACGAAAALLTAAALSQVDDEKMRRWQKYALPGEHHRALEVYEGEWDVTMRMWMEGPDRPPMESRATTRNTTMFGGRFLQTKMAGTMSMEIQGELMELPVEALGYTGYDNFKEKYVAVWIDSHATGIWYGEGTADETGKVFTYFSAADNWETGRRDNPYMMVERVVDENTIVTEMYDLARGPNGNRIWEATSRRKPDRAGPKPR